MRDKNLKQILRAAQETDNHDIDVPDASERIKRLAQMYALGKDGMRIKEKKLTGRRKRLIFIAAVTAAILIIGGLTTFLVVFQNGRLRNLSNLYIKDFKSAVALGVGGLPKAGKSNTVYADDGQADKKDALISVDDLGQVREVVFTNPDTEKEIKADGNLSGFYSGKNFSFVEFTTENTYNRIKSKFMVYKRYNIRYITRSYCIDNKTGKVYSLRELGDIIKEKYYGKVENENFAAVTVNLLPEFLCAETENSTFCEIIYERWSMAPGEGPYAYRGIYKFSVLDGKLETKEIINSDLTDYTTGNTSLNGYDWKIAADRFENFYIFSSAGYEDNNGKWTFGTADYLIKTEGVPKLVMLNKEVFLAANNIMYTRDGTQFMNEDGQLAPSEFEPGIYYNFRYDDLIRKEGNVEYYWRGRNYYYNLPGSERSDKIDKLTWISGTEFKVEEIKLEEMTDKFVIMPDAGKIYFLKGIELFAIDITSGEKETISSAQYIFKNIWSNNMGEVMFSGTNSSLQQVTGKILVTGEFTVDIKEVDSVVIYIKPLN